MSERRDRRGSAPVARPSLLTGTSSEFLGRRALPRVLAERAVVFVLGDPGSGKSSVGARIAHGRARAPALVIDTRGLQNAMVDRVAQLRWSERLLTVPALLLDGPVWLRNRPAAVDVLCELLHARSRAGLTTVVCQSVEDCSIEVLMPRMEPGSLAVVGLRFPKGERGRLRFARRACDELDLPRTAARGTELIEPWGYAQVIDSLRVQRTGVLPPSAPLSTPLPRPAVSEEPMQRREGR